MSIPVGLESNLRYKHISFAASFAVGEEHRDVDLVIKDLTQHRLFLHERGLDPSVRALVNFYEPQLVLQAEFSRFHGNFSVEWAIQLTGEYGSDTDPSDQDGSPGASTAWLKRVRGRLVTKTGDNADSDACTEGDGDTGDDEAHSVSPAEAERGLRRRHRGRHGEVRPQEDAPDTN